MDIPDGQVCKALEMHRTYFNGRMINVEETKNGGKNSAVGNSLDHSSISLLIVQKKKDFINRMRKLHNERNTEQNVGYSILMMASLIAQRQFIEQYLKTKKAKFVWSVGRLNGLSHIWLSIGI